jgi:4-aminobutyrate aminotransferase
MGEPTMSFRCAVGTEAVEAAISSARYCHQGASRFIGSSGASTGAPMGSAVVTSSKYTQQKGFFATMPGVTHVPIRIPTSTVRGR